MNRRWVGGSMRSIGLALVALMPLGCVEWFPERPGLPETEALDAFRAPDVDRSLPGAEPADAAQADAAPLDAAPLDAAPLDAAPLDALQDMVPQPDQTPCTPTGDELCNGEDDDCDGMTDEGYAVGEICTVGEGACAASSAWACLGGDSVCDAEEGAPVDEDCNGVDDDCDGAVDEGPSDEAPMERSCFPYDDGAPDVGPCRAGTQVCMDDAWTPCVGDVGPLAERCNTVDDDCNGAIDDVDGVCVCTVGEERLCYSGPEGTEWVGRCEVGLQVCRDLDGGGSFYTPCRGEDLPEHERCNGIDDDCDGFADEGGFGPCAVGVGACETAGVLACLGGEQVCPAEPGAPADEVCNGVDDDCDGTADELEPEPCAIGLGACTAVGQFACADDGGVECVGDPGAAMPELCNGIDDDCDGTADELPDVICPDATLCVDGRCT